LHADIQRWEEEQADFVHGETILRDLHTKYRRGSPGGEVRLPNSHGVCVSKRERARRIGAYP
jgi:hypothetical protein